MEYGVIWDMDGVLIPGSPKISWSSFRTAIKPYGVRLPRRDSKFAGRSLRDQVNMWNQEYGLAIDFQAFSDRAWQIQLEILSKMSARRDLVELLDDLKSHNIPMGVGTASQRFRADKILEILELGRYFPVVVTANDVEKHKPNPELFLETARRLSIPPERCVVIEDAANGIEAARRGNMESIGYLNRDNSREDLQNADLVVRSFRDLSYEIIGGLL